MNFFGNNCYKNYHHSECIPKGNARTKVIIFVNPILVIANYLLDQKYSVLLYSVYCSIQAITTKQTFEFFLDYQFTSGVTAFDHFEFRFEPVRMQCILE